MNDKEISHGSVPPVRPPGHDRPAPTGDESHEPLAIEFDGNASEYFGIWIVNLLLTVVTLGVWGAWAKVRRLRYFYGNTRLGSDNFDFLATGLQIFKGRVFALLVFAGLSATQFISPIAQLIATLLLLPLLPWIINLSLRFRAGMTVWRNIRFGFEGNYWGALGVFIAMPIAGLATMGLLLPLAGQMAARYVTRNYRYGAARFDAKPDVGEFYAAFFMAIAIVLGAFVVAFVPLIGVAIAIGPVVEKPGADLEWYLQYYAKQVGPAFISSIYLFVIAIIVGYIAAAQVYIAKTRNAVINSLNLDGGHRFRSALSGFKLAWITISNMVVIVFTVGLMQPWAAVRIWKYQAGRYVAHPASPVDRFVDEQREAVGAFGSEFGDFEGFDIGIGL
ncbi:MAG: YjgN family protein [Alphaproteobacteria bacterium]|nr:YjgN family protein [Alphaproteobacteria bacterium]